MEELSDRLEDRHRILSRPLFDINTIRTLANLNENDVRCDVCLWDDDRQDDEIVFCEMCLATH